MTTVRISLVGVAALVSTGFACDPSQPNRLQVALRSDTPAASGVDMLAGDTIAVVRLDQIAPVTVASTPAATLVAPFRAALGQPSRPATSPALVLVLPSEVAAELTSVPFDIVFFRDSNRDRAWQSGESYATAWTGGRGGFRIILERVPGPQWRLVEGGEPPTTHPDVALPVYIDPVRPAVER